ncbi:hypothetical protein BDV06DRAFT_226428, partial [Aspergillus oleicola]
MPHSVASEGSNDPHKDDEVLPDAPATPNGDAAEKATTGVKLEDMFNDDDEDDNEFPASSAPAEQKSEPAKPQGPPPVQVDTETMLVFYQRL